MSKPRGRAALALFGVLTLVTAADNASGQPLTFSHLAGGLGGPACVDGTGSAARFYGPFGVAVDAAGNGYVADSNNNRIRKITAGGTVTTFAGSGVHASTDGTGAEAEFSQPAGVAIDAAGNVFVVETAGGKVRKITPGGVVTTLAGSGAPGSADGTGAAASFYYPGGIAVDGAGTVYVADQYSHKVRRVTPAGVVTTLAGSGTQGSADGMGTSASFNYPRGIAVDAAGNIFVADTGSRKVRKVTPAGVVTTLAGSGSTTTIDGIGTAASFESPAGIAVDAGGVVYVSDLVGRRIRKIGAGAVVTTLAGSGSRGGADGTGAAASFDRPAGVAVDGAGNVYVAEQEIHEIRKVSAAGVVTTLAGLGSQGGANGVAAAASFDVPYGIAVDQSGNTYVADNEGCRIRKITAGGTVTTLAGSGAIVSADGTGTSAAFWYPTGIAVDASGNVYVAETGAHKIRKVTPAGVVTSLAGSGTSGFVDWTGPAASFSSPAGVAVDGSGNVFVADQYNRRIRKVTPGGAVTTVAGSGASGSEDGTGAAATFKTPAGIALDSAGTLYVVDRTAHNIRKVTGAGVVSTLAGSGASGFADGTGAGAKFSGPTGVALDGAGNLYVADQANHRIRKVTAGGVVTTVGGSGTMGSVDGTGTAAAFADPSGVAVDASGNVLVADSLNNAVRVGRPLSNGSCAVDDATLCLLGGRFRVTADYGDYGGGHGTGHAVPLTSDTGYFWFFSSANVEAVVKMVSFCGGGSSNVAVYAGGLTDLEVNLHVTDTRSGTTKDYRNGLGTPFTLLRDGPFACPAGATESGDLLLAGSEPLRETVGMTESTWWTSPSGIEAFCPGDGETLCLLGGRFWVKASYVDYSGNSGAGKAVGLTADTGYFWFFSQANVEVVAKMVSFCGSGSNNVGIYGGGLTDIGVTLTVTDTATGLVKSYSNPVGNPFRLVRDGPFTCR